MNQEEHVLSCSVQMPSILTNLLSLAMASGHCNESFEKVEDWELFIERAGSQGVDAIAYDGLQKAYETIPEVAEYLDKPENKSLKYDWFGQALSAEVKYDKQLKAASELSALWASHGIRAVVMKGFAYARFYPVPQHRYCSDLDCYLFDKWEEGNRVVEDSGVKVSRGFYKNSSFTFAGLPVENHRFCSPVRGGKRRKEYEFFLRGLLDEGPLAPLDETAFLCPPPMFDTVFFMSHAQNHFLAEGGIQLRHVCDWAMLMKAYASVLDWDVFLMNCDRFGLRKFAESMSQVAKKVCGVEIPFECPVREKADDAMLEEIMNPTCEKVEFGKGWHTRRQLVRSMLKSGWKYRLYSNQTMFGALLGSAWAYLFEKNPELK